MKHVIIPIVITKNAWFKLVQNGKIKEASMQIHIYIRMRRKFRTVALVSLSLCLSQHICIFNNKLFTINQNNFLFERPFLIMATKQTKANYCLQARK